MKVRNVLTQPEQIDAAREDGYPYALTEREVQEVLVCWCGRSRGKTQGQQVGRVNGRYTAPEAADGDRPRADLAGSRTGG